MVQSKVKMIVGLGNPGSRYEYTRHNLGFLVIRYLVQKYGLTLKLSSFTNGLSAEGVIDSMSVVLLMPLTYMNHSGLAVKQTFDKFQCSLDDVLVIVDDLDLAFNQIRIRPKGSSGGHNGLKSIISKLDAKDFARLRMGIDQPVKKTDTIDYVLENFSKAEKKQLASFVDAASECCLVWLKEGTNKAMEQFNKKVEV